MSLTLLNRLIQTFKFLQLRQTSQQSYQVKNQDLTKIQGISAGFIPETLDTEAYDGIVRVTSDNALALGREIGGKEGFLVGISSAAAIYAAIEVAKKLGAGKKVLALAPDNGERYLSTALYEFEV